MRIGRFLIFLNKFGYLIHDVFFNIRFSQTVTQLSHSTWLANISSKPHIHFMICLESFDGFYVFLLIVHTTVVHKNKIENYSFQ